MGVLPLRYSEGESAETLGLTGEEHFSITGIVDGLEPSKQATVTAEVKEGIISHLKRYAD